MILSVLFGNYRQNVDTNIISMRSIHVENLKPRENTGLDYLLEEDFNAGAQSGTLPTDWNFENSNPNCKDKIWQIYWNADFANGFLLYYPYFDGGWQSGNDKGKTITCPVDFSGIETAAISFYQELNYYSGNGITVSVEYRVNNGDWTSIWTETTAQTINNIQMIKVPEACLNQSNVEFAFVFDGEISEINYWIIDDFQVFTPPSDEVFVLENNLNLQVPQNSGIVPEIEIRSFGSATNNFNMFCKVFYNGTELYNQSVMVDELDFLDYKTVTFPEFMVPETNCAYEFIFHSEFEINAGEHQSAADTSIGWIDSNSGEKEAVVWEEYTNTGCGPCASVNPGLTTAINSIDENKILPIFVHVDWPSDADPYYKAVSEVCDNRTQYYSVSGVPHGIVDGEIHPNVFSNVTNNAKSAVNSSAEVGSPILMSANTTIDNDGFSTTVNVEMIGDIRNPGDVVLHVVAVESNLKFNAPNGERNFDWVLRNYFPNVSGTKVEIVKGESGSYVIEGNFGSSWDREEIDLYAFVQNNNTKRILQGTRLGSPTSIENNVESIVEKYNLDQNYPNPFNPITQISYTIPNQNFVELSIYDIKGSKIRTLVNSTKSSGKYSVIWNAKNDFGKLLPAGLYFYQLKTSKNVFTKKMLLVK